MIKKPARVVLTVPHSHGRHRSAERDGAHGGLEQVRRPLTGHEGARPNTPAIALEPPPKDPFRTPPINVSGRARAIVCCRSSARVEQRARPLSVFDRSNVPRIASPLTRRSDPLHLFVLVVRLSAGAGAQTLLAAFARRRVDRAGRGDALAHARRRRAARAWVALAAAPQPRHRAPRLSSPRPLLVPSPVVVLVSRLLFGRRSVLSEGAARGGRRATRARRARRAYIAGGSYRRSSAGTSRAAVVSPSRPLFSSRRRSSSSSRVFSSVAAPC